MNEPFEALVEREKLDGRRLHAHWEPDRFDRLMRGPAAGLRDRLLGRQFADETIAAYAMLLREALGSGYLGQSSPATEPECGPWPNFLAFALLKLVPESLADEPDAERVARLACLWNIGEGLLSEPAWVDRYLLAYSANLRRVGDVESFVVETLGPALAPSEPASWSGPFSVSTLDARPVLDGFLPGEMVLAAPRILCVQDRRDPGQHLGLLLGHGGQSRWLGPTPAMETYVEEGPVPPLRVVGARAKVGSHPVDLPLIGEPHRTAIARAGFVVVSSVDSQRLWIVETR
jgi:hypothetical protein